eukprot:TRINITY_DN46929_c0_g1_i1.p1 TRINITY_DN46929_c0_g1~~TRINITY_DN46929_c0_g1_i1.p1  ORF type:complete len:650 (+),score=158.43 TRINITY_DN46929_c0_g1_i1:69-2018(+)
MKLPGAKDRRTPWSSLGVAAAVVTLLNLLDAAGIVSFVPPTPPRLENEAPLRQPATTSVGSVGVQQPSAPSTASSSHHSWKYVALGLCAGLVVSMTRVTAFDGEGMLENPAASVGVLGGVAALAGLIARPGAVFELIRLTTKHPTLEDGTRMEPWAEPVFPVGNFHQHVTMCPYKVIQNMLATSSQQNGAVVDYRLPIPGVMLVDNDQAVREVLSAQVTPKALRSLGENLPPYKKLFGKGIFMITGEDWKRQLRIAGRGFGIKQMEESAPVVARTVEDEFQRLEKAITNDPDMPEAVRSATRKELGLSLEDGKIILDPGEFMKNVVLRVLTNVAFGQDVEDADRNAVLRCFNLFYDASLTPAIALPGYLDSPLPGAAELKQAIDDLHQIGYKFVAKERAKMTDARQRVADENEGQTLLAALLNARDEDESKLSEEEVVHNVFAFMVAGIATTSDSLASSAFLLARHPQVQEELRQELKDARGWEDVKSLPYLSAAITEQLRVWPPLIGVPPRTMSEDTVLGGIKVPEGMDVSIHGLALHRRTKYWGDDAEEYRPERFLDGGAERRRITNPMLPSPLPEGVPEEAFVAFGGGVRPCVARPLAMIEMKLVLMQLLQRFRVVETKPEEFGMQIAFPVVFPKRHLRLQLIPQP